LVLVSGANDWAFFRNNAPVLRCNLSSPETSSGLERIFTATGAKFGKISVFFLGADQKFTLQVSKETIQTNF